MTLNIVSASLILTAVTVSPPVGMKLQTEADMTKSLL